MLCVSWQDLGYGILATGGTQSHLKAAGINSEQVLKIQEGRPNAADLVKNGDIAMMLITSTGVPVASSAVHSQKFMCRCCRAGCIALMLVAGDTCKFVPATPAACSSACFASSLQSCICSQL